jgi:hypothetical protein
MLNRLAYCKTYIRQESDRPLFGSDLPQTEEVAEVLDTFCNTSIVK